MSGYRIGFAGSLLLHGGLLGMWWALADIPERSGRSVDQPLPLSLAMFHETPGARHEPAPPTVNGVPPKARENGAVKPPPEEETPKVQKSATRAPSEAEAPTLTQVTEKRAPKAAKEPALQSKPKPRPATVARVVEPPPIRRSEAKRQRHLPPRSSEPRRFTKPARSNAPAPAAVAALATPAAIAAPSGAQQRHHSSRAAKLEDEYLERLWRALERSKFYPRRARRKGLRGLVQVRFRVLRDGSFDDLEVVVGSGNRVLDEAAVQTVNKVSGAFPFPSELPKQALVVSLPITYRWQ